ncbi:MAG: YggT family protein [Holophagaceae bacterium]
MNSEEKMTQILVVLLSNIISLWSLLIFIWAISTWFNPDPSSTWFRILNAVVEPILLPFQRLIPRLGPLDLSTLFALIALRLINELLLSRMVIN